MSAYQAGREYELRDGAGRVIRPAPTRALAEIRMLLEAAIAYDKPFLWTSVGLLAQQHASVLLTALPTEHDPSDREEAAYVAGQRSAVDAFDAWLANQQGMHRDSIPTDEIRAWVQGR